MPPNVSPRKVLNLLLMNESNVLRQIAKVLQKIHDNIASFVKLKPDNTSSSSAHAGEHEAQSSLEKEVSGTGPNWIKSVQHEVRLAVSLPYCEKHSLKYNWMAIVAFLEEQLPQDFLDDAAHNEETVTIQVVQAHLRYGAVGVIETFPSPLLVSALKRVWGQTLISHGLYEGRDSLALSQADSRQTTKHNQVYVKTGYRDGNLEARIDVFK